MIHLKVTSIMHSGAGVIGAALAAIIVLASLSGVSISQEYQ